MKFLEYIRGRAFITIVLLLAVLAGVFGASFLIQPPVPSYSEVNELATKGLKSFQEYSTYFRELAEDKGAPYAFEILLRAEFPPQTDLHLLAHVVGDILYKQQGIQGIYVCTQDFRNACSHSVVIGILNEKGESALEEIADTCKKAPGGKGAYTMCFHGLGHGVLAFNQYRLEKAVEMCRKTGTVEYQNREFVECVGGTIMEMIAGVHDPEVWEKESKNYFKTEDPLYPCTAPFMPREALGMCLTYLTPHLFLSAGMDLGNMNPELYPKAFSYCDALPPNDIEARDACYSGFGKEFIGLAQSRDVRDIGSTKEPALRKIREWCGMAGTSAGTAYCNASALSSIFWGGENKPDAAFIFCDIAPTDAERGVCYTQLANAVAFYLPNSARGLALCDRMPEPARSECRTKVR
jgi:hypothetical protein